MADHAAQSDCTPITVLLDQARDGDESAVEQVWRAMHTEIHQIAKGFAARENVGSTIQASVLINEAYLRLFGGQIPDYSAQISARSVYLLLNAIGICNLA